jgi:hypothetical protein
MTPDAPAFEAQPRRLAVAVILAVLVAVGVAGAFFLGRTLAPDERGHVVFRPTPSVILAMRDLSRLESATFHMEKVVELTDEQSTLFGLVQAKDQILLVAAGDVVAGVDMAKLGEGDVQAEPAGSVHIVLPAPEVFSTAIDQKLTHVYGRSTDLLATRKEELETLARKEAAEQIEQGAREGGILDRARTSAERTVRALVLSLGFQQVVIEWKG